MWSFPIFAALMALAFRRSLPPGSRVTLRQYALLLCVIFALLFPPTIVFYFKSPAAPPVAEAWEVVAKHVGIGITPLAIFFLFDYSLQLTRMLVHHSKKGYGSHWSGVAAGALAALAVIVVVAIELQRN